MICITSFLFNILEKKYFRNGEELCKLSRVRGQRREHEGKRCYDGKGEQGLLKAVKSSRRCL